MITFDGRQQARRRAAEHDARHQQPRPVPIQPPSRRVDIDKTMRSKAVPSIFRR